MKNHFYMSYIGNKRTEVEKIYENLNFDGIDTIIEPFCGSCAMSYYIWLKHPNMKFILNDNNKYLLEMFHIIKNDSKRADFQYQYAETFEYMNYQKDLYNEIVKQDNLIGWFIGNKVYQIRPKLCPFGYKDFKDTIDLTSYPIYNFFYKANIEFYNKDAIEIYDKYKGLSNCMLLLDPPYLSAFNDFYMASSIKIYEHLHENNIKNEKAKIYVIVADNWMIKLLFDCKNNKFVKYNKKYELGKKNVEHIIITNV